MSFVWMSDERQNNIVCLMFGIDKPKTGRTAFWLGKLSFINLWSRTHNCDFGSRIYVI